MTSKKIKGPVKKEKVIVKGEDIESTSIRMNINIPKSFHKQIKQKALDEDTTVTELVIRALTEYLK